jgi:hypothetical protein
MPGCDERVSWAVPQARELGPFSKTTRVFIGVVPNNGKTVTRMVHANAAAGSRMGAALYVEREKGVAPAIAHAGTAQHVSQTPASLSSSTVEALFSETP